MSHTPILRFEQVSKRFTYTQEQPGTILESLIERVLPRRRRQRQVLHPGELWALRDVSFAVLPGESVGIIGRNGSGKSTLLKLASRILKPTGGKVEVRGRVSALLELGAGFHPDLTGEENIYLNGSLLGLSKQEMDICYQDIVNFSELNNYIHMRLGFSVAIHVQPELLIVDEILAVGDQAFQNKCIERIYDMKRSGVTVVMVSHNLESIRGICSRVVWIENGVQRAVGPTDEVIAQYLEHTYSHAPGGKQWVKVGDETFQRWGSREIEITAVRLLDESGQPANGFKTNDPVVVEIAYVAHEPVQDPVFGLAIFRTDGLHVNGPNVRHAGLEMGLVQGAGVLRYRVDHLPLLPAQYKITVAVYDSFIKRPFDHHDRAYPLRVIGGGTKEIDGVVAFPAVWEWEKGSEQ
jgi:ABC-type polysaccharide/polyol phosphate transport system ATPase subunit